MLVFRHIGLIILGVFGVFHLTMCCGVLCCLEMLSSTELHLQSQRKSWLVNYSTLGIAQLVGGGGGKKYLHSTQPWVGNLTYPVTCSGCHQNLRKYFSSCQAQWSSPAKSGPVFTYPYCCCCFCCSVHSGGSAATEPRPA